MFWGSLFQIVEEDVEKACWLMTLLMPMNRQIVIGRGGSLKAYSCELVLANILVRSHGYSYACRSEFESSQSSYKVTDSPYSNLTPV